MHTNLNQEQMGKPWQSILQVDICMLFCHWNVQIKLDVTSLESINNGYLIDETCHQGQYLAEMRKDSTYIVLRYSST
jgi:hypothetical protein